MTQPAPEGQGQAAPQGDGGTPEPQQQQPTEQQPPEPQGQQQSSSDGGGQDLEYWKKRARENEQKAKQNAKAAQRLQELEDQGKSAQQIEAEAVTRAQQERDEARAEGLRWKAAAKYRVGEDHFELLGTGTEEEIDARAKLVGQLLADSAELKAIKERQAAEQQQQEPQGDGTGPVPKLAPGTPPKTDNTYPTDWFPTKKRKHDQPAT